MANIGECVLLGIYEREELNLSYFLWLIKRVQWNRSSVFRVAKTEKRSLAMLSLTYLMRARIALGLNPEHASE